VAHIIQCDIKLRRPEERDGCKGETHIYLVKPDPTSAA
jgi:hypothetical protein